MLRYARLLHRHRGDGPANDEPNRAPANGNHRWPSSRSSRTPATTAPLSSCRCAVITEGNRPHGRYYGVQWGDEGVIVHLDGVAISDIVEVEVHDDGSARCVRIDTPVHICSAGHIARNESVFEAGRITLLEPRAYG